LFFLIYPAHIYDLKDRKTQKESETQRRTRMKPNGRREMGRQQREGNM